MTRTALHILPDTTTVVLRNVVGVTPLEGEGSPAQYYFKIITTGGPYLLSIKPPRDEPVCERCGSRCAGASHPCLGGVQMTRCTKLALGLLLIGCVLFIARADADQLGSHRIAAVYRILILICFLSSIGLNLVDGWRKKRS